MDTDFLLTTNQQGTTAGRKIEDHVMETGGAIREGIRECLDID